MKKIFSLMMAMVVVMSVITSCIHTETIVEDGTEFDGCWTVLSIDGVVPDYPCSITINGASQRADMVNFPNKDNNGMMYCQPSGLIGSNVLFTDEIAFYTYNQAAYFTMTRPNKKGGRSTVKWHQVRGSGTWDVIEGTEKVLVIQKK